MFTPISVFKITYVNAFQVSESYDLLVCNLPDDKDVVGIKRRLKQLSNNCGGRVVQVRSNAAVVRFCSKESADRYVPKRARTVSCARKLAGGRGHAFARRLYNLNQYGPSSRCVRWPNAVSSTFFIRGSQFYITPDLIFFLRRAQKRMHGEYVFDSKITVKYLKEKESCPPKNRGKYIYTRHLNPDLRPVCLCCCLAAFFRTRISNFVRWSRETESIDRISYRMWLFADREQRSPGKYSQRV